MNEISVGYNTVDEKKLEKTGKIQLGTAALALMVATADTFDKYSGFSILIPIGFILMIIGNLGSLVSYKYLYKKFGISFEIFLQLISGITMVLTAASYYFVGASLRMSIIYLCLGCTYIFLIPLLIYKGNYYRKITLSKKGIIFHKRLIQIKHINWENIESIDVFDNHIKVKVISKKPKKYFLIDPDQDPINKFKEISSSKLTELELVSN